MIRNIVGSWLLAAFLVVVAVGTWRLLDAGRSSCTRGSCPHALVADASEPAHTCGSASEPLEAPPEPVPVEAPPPPPVEPVHTCGAGANPIDGQLDAHDPFEPVVPAAPAPLHFLTNEEAQLLYEDAVGHLRQKDNAGGCRILHRIVTNAHPTNAWRNRSEHLIARRCGP